jgi:hypothetical protein
VFWRTYAQIVKMTVKMMKQDRVQKDSVVYWYSIQ